MGSSEWDWEAECCYCDCWREEVGKEKG
jgi:hypothetical protein